MSGVEIMTCSAFLLKYKTSDTELIQLAETLSDVFHESISTKEKKKTTFGYFGYLPEERMEEGMKKGTTIKKGKFE